MNLVRPIAWPVTLVLAARALVVLAAFAAPVLADPTLPEVKVYKTPTCGCCTKWIDSLEAEGFRVVATDLPDLRMLKAENGIPGELHACHTAVVGGYIVEGHVPAADVKRLLAEKPAVSGLAVPGMPLGSPGMEHADPSRHEAYDVLSFGPAGVKRFSHHEP